MQCQTQCTKINGRTRTTRKRESHVSPVASGVCSGRLTAQLWSRCPSVIPLTLSGASSSQCARKRRSSPGSVRDRNKMGIREQRQDQYLKMAQYSCC